MSGTRLATAHLRAIAVLAGTVVFAGAAALRYRSLERSAIDLWRGRMETSAEATRQMLQTWLEEHQADNRILAQEAAANWHVLGDPGQPANVAERASSSV